MKNIAGDETNDLTKKNYSKIENKEYLENILVKLQELKEKLQTIDNDDERVKIIEELETKEENLNKSDEKEIELELEDLKQRIKKTQDDIISKSKEYDKLYFEMQSIIDEQNNKMNGNNLLSEREILEIYSFYNDKKSEINSKSAKLSLEIEKQRNRIYSLKNRIRLLEGKLNNNNFDNSNTDTNSISNKEIKKNEIDILHEFDSINKGKAESIAISMSINDINNILNRIKFEPKKFKANFDSNINYIPAPAPEDMSNIEISSIKYDEDNQEDEFQEKLEEKENYNLDNPVAGEVNLYSDLDIDDGYKATNIKVSKQFVDELSFGEYLYNIVCVVPNMVKASASFLTKLGSKLLQSYDKNMIETVPKISDFLSEDDLDNSQSGYRHK